jgi:nucleotide-binding universal stress UspA family protein
MMTGPGKHLHVRITVMLGNTDGDRIALEMLGLLTAETPAEILGLFMEDIELLSLADLPVAREYCRLTHVERQLNSADLRRQLRIQARSAQQALAAIAERSGFSWSFQTVRGSPASLLQNAAADMDLMLLGAARRTQPLPGHFASTPLPVPFRPPVTVIFDGSEATQRALAVALRLARAGEQSLNVFLVAENSDDFTSLREQTIALAGPVALRFHERVNPDISEILAAVRSERAGTLVLGMNKLLISPESIEMLHKRLSCPAVLVK